MHDHDHDQPGRELPMHGQGHDSQPVGPGQALDPVCGMVVDQATARSKGLVAEHAGETYFFCGKGCLLDFQEDPARYFEPGYRPSM